MFAVAVCSLAAVSMSAPSGVALPLAAAPVVPVAAPAPVVTAYSSQYVARNYNGVVAAPAAVVPAASYVGYPPVYAPAAAYPGPVVEDFLF